jgi:hypothetical protein
MTFSSKSLARRAQVPIGSATGLAQAKQSSAFDYATDDAAATVETAGYFNSARALLGVGDKIDAVMVASTAPVRKNYVVTAVPTTGNVTVALQATSAG